MSLVLLLRVLSPNPRIHHEAKTSAAERKKNLRDAYRKVKKNTEKTAYSSAALTHFVTRQSRAQYIKKGTANFIESKKGYFEN